MPTPIAEDALATITPSVPSTTLPVLSEAQMADALTRYRELQALLDKAMPDEIMTLDGKLFRKKGYWRAIRIAFNLSVEPTTPHAQRTVHGTLDDGSENYVYSVVYRASAPSGASCTGDGTCEAAEKSKGRMKATEHNVCSHAHTRALNRAISNLVGFGEVSAEEVYRPDGAAVSAPEVTTAPGEPLYISEITSTVGTNKKTGKAWTMYTIAFTDGRAASTFDEGLASRAEDYKYRHVPVLAYTAQKGRYTNLVRLDPVDQPLSTQEQESIAF